MYLILYLMYYLILAVFLYSHIRKYMITPVSIFLILQGLMFSGLIAAPQINTPAARKLSVIYYFAMLFFISGVIITNSVQKRRAVNGFSSRLQVMSDNDPSKNQIIKLWFVLVISVMFSVYLFAEAGGNVLLKSLNSLVRGHEVTIQSDRRNFLSVSGTGYLYQFRAILVPILSAFFLWGTNSQNDKRLVYNLIFIMAIFFVLGSGQRNAFVFFGLFVVVFLYYSSKIFQKKVNTTHLLLFVSFSIVFLVALTITNNRVKQYHSSNAIVGAILSLIDRFLGVNSRTAITAFTYIDEQTTVWGYDWMMMLVDILPGKTDYLSIERIVYRILYGTYNGTGPPCIWGSAWYNWSFLGVSLFPFILGIVYQNIFWHFKRKPVDRIRLFIYSAKVVYFGIWFVGSPMFLFNNGAVAISILSFILQKKGSPFKVTTVRVSRSNL